MNFAAHTRWATGTQITTLPKAGEPLQLYVLQAHSQSSIQIRSILGKQCLVWIQLPKPEADPFFRSDLVSPDAYREVYSMSKCILGHVVTRTPGITQRSPASCRGGSQDVWGHFLRGGWLPAVLPPSLSFCYHTAAIMGRMHAPGWARVYGRVARLRPGV